MGKNVKNPRYNIVTTRLNDDEHSDVLLACKAMKESTAIFLRQALTERLDRIRQL